MADPKSIYMFLLLIVIKLEIIILDAGPAETKNIRSLFFASFSNLGSKELLISFHFQQHAQV
jgi:hypothetical protein